MDELIDEIGIVISGIVTIESIDLWGNKSILSNIACGHVFAETYCFCREPLQVEVISASNTEILFLNISRLFTQSDNNNIAKTLSQKSQVICSPFHAQKPYFIKPHFLYISQNSQKPPAHFFIK